MSETVLERVKRAMTDARAVMDLASLACDGDHLRAIYALLAAAIALARGKLVAQASTPESVLPS